MGGRVLRRRGIREQATALFGHSFYADSKGKETFKTSGDPQCANCGKSHHILRCFLFERKSIDDRLQLVKDKGLCFNCLAPTSPSHYSIACKCPGCSLEGCKRNTTVYFTVVLPPSIKLSNAQIQTKMRKGMKLSARAGVARGYFSTSTDNQEILLPTARVNLVSRDVTLPVRVLVDSGSDQSCMRQKIVEALGLDLNGSAKSMTILLHGGQTTRVKKANFQLTWT